ncbi:MAG: hypothetical protein IT204_07260 [Fimbriimonadaceae bacterium]|nr:hypothetical protein [Fimbriimonadaceae bacterium]
MIEAWITRGVRLTCPRCGRRLSADLRAVADVAVEPRLLQAAERGALHRVTCPTCRHRFVAPRPLLFVQAARRRALAYVPEGLEAPDGVVGELLARWLSQATESPDDWLLEPMIYRDGAAFVEALRGVGEQAAGGELHPGLVQAAEWCHAQGEPEVARALEALLEVGDLTQLVAAANQAPELLEPAVLRQLQHLGDLAEARGRAALADLLRDVAGALRAHVPAEDDPETEGLPAEVAGALTGGDLEAASEFLERPAPVDDLNARRALQVAQEPEQREGFSEHARLFGGIVEQMLVSADQQQQLLVQTVLQAEGGELPPGLTELLQVPTVDLAREVLARYPLLICRETVGILRRAQAAAEDLEDGSLVSFLETLVLTLYVAAEDDLDLGDED